MSCSPIDVFFRTSTADSILFSVFELEDFLARFQWLSRWKGSLHQATSLINFGTWMLIVVTHFSQCGHSTRLPQPVGISSLHNGQKLTTTNLFVFISLPPCSWWMISPWETEFLLSPNWNHFLPIPLRVQPSIKPVVNTRLVKMNKSSNSTPSISFSFLTVTPGQCTLE